MHRDNRPIGVFDSGIGGLTVASAIRKALPSEDIIYLGDTARVPYGDKSPASIIRFSFENASFLLNLGVKLIVVACNTVSALAIQELRKKFPHVPVIGVLEAGIDACLKEEPESVAVIATRATIKSDAYRRELHRHNPEITVKSIACPLFVPIVEEGLTEHKICSLAMELYLKPLLADPPALLLLACTHYPLLREPLKSYLPAGVKIIDSATACAKYTADYLRKNKLAAKSSSAGIERFYVTDMSSAFYGQAKKFFGCELEHVEKIAIDSRI